MLKYFHTYSILLLTSCLLITSCNEKRNNWKINNLGIFTVNTPLTWHSFKFAGIDSYVGGLTNTKDTLWFDYGRYHNELNLSDSIHYLSAIDTINGLVSSIVIPKHNGKGVIGMYMYVSDYEMLSMYGENINSTDTVLKIFKSIIFKESDTSVNGILTMAKFNNKPLFNGKAYYLARCSECHADGDVENFSLKHRLEERSEDWLFTFFTNRDMVANDSMHILLKSAFGNRECAVIPQITKYEIKVIKNYVLSK